VDNTPPNLSVVGTPPATVSAIVRTTDERQSNLRAENFQAVVSLAGLEPGLHQLPVTVISALSPVQIVSVIPDVINIELAPIVNRIMAVTVDVPDQQNLPGAYEIIGLPLTAPREVEMVGPESLINQVKEIRASVSVLNATSSIRSLRPLRAIAENGQEISGITFNPAEVQVTLTINRRSDARDVGVRPNMEGTPPEGYWLSSLTASPTSVTLQGSPDLLVDINGFIDTLPVDVSQAEGELSILVPLDLPPNVTAVDANGAPVQMVTVTAQIEVRTGDLLLSRPINLIGVREGVDTAVTPETLDLLLSGPLPILKQIEANPELVQLVVDVARLVPIEGQSYEETPQVTAPVGIKVQWNPLTVLITMER
jgi:YbbR domain-containing protein